MITRRIIGSTVLLLAVAACAGGGEEAPVERLGEREIHSVSWDTVFRIGGEVQDTMLFMPRLITAGGDGLYAYDYHDGRVKSFDPSGALRWTFGRHGDGPGEFGNPTHVTVAADGAVWITDPGAGRFTVLSGDGSLDRLIPMRGALVMRSIPFTNETLALPTDPERFWIALDTQGEVGRWGPPPTLRLEEADPLVRPPAVSRSSTDDRWAAVFPFGDPIVVYDGTDIRCDGSLVEGDGFPGELPAPDGDFSVWATAIALSDSSAFVLMRGETEYERRIIDEYSTDDCRYLRTLLLPAEMQGLAYHDGVFYFYREEPVPTLLALRPVFEE